MADELTQSGFDKTIKKLSAEMEAAGDGVERSVEDQSVVLERIIGKSVKAIITGFSNSTRLVEQISMAQQAVQQEELDQDKQNIFLLTNIGQTLRGLITRGMTAFNNSTELVEQISMAQQTVQEEQIKQDKQNIFVLTNMGQSLRGLLTLGLNAKLSDTERKREEKRTGDALIGALTDVGDGLKGVQSKLGDALKLALNPLGLIGAIVGIAIGTVGGLFAFISKALNLPGLVKGLLAPINLLLSPKSRFGKAIAGIVKFFGKSIVSFVKVFGRVSAFVIKSIPLVEKLFRFIKPFLKFGLKLGGLIGKLALPLTIAISIVKAVLGFMDELKKGGDLIDASLRAIGDVLDFLTFGVLNADQLKKFIGEPIRNFIAGIKELFTEGFSIATLNKIMEPLIRFILATPNILIAGIGKITAFIAEKLGFENFAKKLTAFLADFDLFTFITDSIQSVIDFFVGIPAALAQLPEILVGISDAIINSVKSVFNKFIDDPLGTVKEIGETIVNMFTKITNTLFDFILSALPDFILPKELQERKAARKVEKEGLEKLAAIQAELGLASLEEAGQELQRRRDLTRVQKLLDQNARTIGTAGAASDQDALDALIVRRKALFQQTKDLEAQTPASLDELALAAPTSSALQLANQMAANASLRDKANRTAPAVLPIPAAPIIAGNASSAAAIIAPLSMRNNENTFRRIMQKDFSGTQG